MIEEDVHCSDIEIPYGANDSELQEATYHIPEGFHAEIEGNKVVIKKGEQKPMEWKQDNIEELTEFEAAMMHIGESFFGEHLGLDPNDTDVIKKQAKLLLELVKPVEWNEEDELMLKSIIQTLNLTNGAAQIKIDWLKSLRPQSRWKPSEEQINSLRWVVEYGETSQTEVLKELLKQLKQL